MENDEKKGGSVLAIVVMFALFFMIAFVTNFASPMGVIAKNQFNACQLALLVSFMPSVMVSGSNVYLYSGSSGSFAA